MYYFVGEVVPRLPFGAIFEQMLSIAQSFRFTIPPYFTSNVRALAELEGLAISADPTYNLLSSVYPFAVQRMIVGPDATLRTALEQLIFDPEEGLRIEVLRSIFGLSMPAPCIPKSRKLLLFNNNTNIMVPECDLESSFIEVAPTREQYAFVQRFLVKILAARCWQYITMLVVVNNIKYIRHIL